MHEMPAAEHVQSPPVAAAGHGTGLNTGVSQLEHDIVPAVLFVALRKTAGSILHALIDPCNPAAQVLLRRGLLRSRPQEAEHR